MSLPTLVQAVPTEDMVSYFDLFQENYDKGFQDGSIYVLTVILGMAALVFVFKLTIKMSKKFFSEKAYTCPTDCECELCKEEVYF